MQNSLVERYFLMIVNLRNLDFSASKTVGYGLVTTKLRLSSVKIRALGFSLVWNVDKKKLHLTSSGSKCDRKDLQKPSSVLCVSETLEVPRRQHFQQFVVPLQSFTLVHQYLHQKLQMLHEESWLHFMAFLLTGVDALWLLFKGIFKSYCILWVSEDNTTAKN